MTIRENVHVGDHFGRLTVTNPQPVPELPYHVAVRCECGTTKLIKVYDALYGRINSCGCICVERARGLAANRRKVQ